jgi:hypothetical protein
MPLSFEDAYTTMRVAKEKFDLAHNERILKDGNIRMAFHNLYQAASTANMLYVSRGRRGVVDEGGLLSWAKSEFKEIIDTLYMRYFRRGSYPKDDFEGEFYRWFGRVKEYINKLAAEAKMEQSVKPAKEQMDKWQRGMN